MINLATKEPLCTANRAQILSAAYLLKLDISFVEALRSFISVSSHLEAKSCTWNYHLIEGKNIKK
ncbi:hypothetical protein A6U94_09475 [Agrobacterium tumefaciens]|jgi:hypothetical protein|nr:hypothetical protein A6U94_09475 [Agrobacterium tumefaciens]